jgi:hypothetical protein
MITLSELPGSKQMMLELRSLHWLFGKVLVVATGFSKHLLERRLTLLIVASVFPQSALDNLA